MEDTILCCDLLLSKSPPFSSDLELGCTRRALIIQAPHRGTVVWAEIFSNFSDQLAPLSLILADDSSPQTAALYPIPLFRLLTFASFCSHLVAD